METTFNNFESVTDSILFEDQQSNFATETFGFQGGEGDDDEEDGDEDESNAGDTGNEDQDKWSDDNNPPLDDEVVHSPLPTQTGGKPGKK